MKQTIRIETFETNSSSTHTLVIVDKDTFEKFKSEELFFNIYSDTFESKEYIIEHNSDFKSMFPDYEIYNEEGLEKAFKDFKYQYMSGDYPTHVRISDDVQYMQTFDKDGNETYAVSIYVNG